MNQEKYPEESRGIRMGEPAMNDCLQTEPFPPIQLKREINIVTLDMGYVIRVGCQSIAISDVETLIEKLEEYLRDPRATEKKYNEKTLFKK